MRVTAWSHSRLALYETCPAQFKYKHIDKLPDPASPAMARGDAIHKSIAAYITNKAEDLVPDAKRSKLAYLIDNFRAWPETDKVVEQQWGFTSAWKPTGWFAKDTWFRSTLDAAALYEDLTGEVVDWKTGKRYGSNDDQMELFALSFMCQYAPATHVTTRLAYIDSGEEEFAEFPVNEKDKLRDKWTARANVMFNDTTFVPRPNEKCRFCAFSKSKGGPCRFG